MTGKRNKNMSIQVGNNRMFHIIHYAGKKAAYIYALQITLKVPNVIIQIILFWSLQKRMIIFGSLFLLIC